MSCRDYKNMYLSARTSDYVILRSLVIDYKVLGLCILVYVVTENEWPYYDTLAYLQLIGQKMRKINHKISMY